MGLVQGFRHIIKVEGTATLFRGLGATAIRAFPTNAATFYTVTLVKNFFDPPFY